MEDNRDNSSFSGFRLNLDFTVVHSDDFHRQRKAQTIASIFGGNFTSEEGFV